MLTRGAVPRVKLARKLPLPGVHDCHLIVVTTCVFATWRDLFFTTRARRTFALLSSLAMPVAPLARIRFRLIALGAFGQALHILCLL